MAVSSYRIKITREGEEFEIEGDKKFVLEMLEQFKGSTPSPSTSEKKPTATKSGLTVPVKSGKAISVGEFVRQLGIKKHTDYVLAFGYFLEKYSGLKDFSPADINVCYYDAKMEASNTSQMIIQDIRRGFLMQAKGDKGGKKRYTLTHSGIAHVESKFKKPTD